MQGGEFLPSCFDCAKFRIKDRYCSYYNAYIAEGSAKKSVPCDGFERRKRRGK
jgi:hypothetical protein